MEFLVAIRTICVGEILIRTGALLNISGNISTLIPLDESGLVPRYVYSIMYIVLLGGKVQ
jgi:hypothetical protein